MHSIYGDRDIHTPASRAGRAFSTGRCAKALLFCGARPLFRSSELVYGMYAM